MRAQANAVLGWAFLIAIAFACVGLGFLVLIVRGFSHMPEEER